MGFLPDAGSLPGAYEGCVNGQSCLGGTTCASAGYTGNGQPASLCTAACSTGNTCPADRPGAALQPTCVINGATGAGQCYGTCTTSADCGANTLCAMIPGAPNRICVPGGGAPPPPAAYTGCTPAGAACASATTCTPSAFMRAGAAPGNLCTVACTSGNAAMCPGYVPGAAVQAVECVAPGGAAAGAQCMRLCNPANGNSDCAPYLSTCASVAMAAGMITVCVP